MTYSLALTALLMGLVGGPHCVAMCGAMCISIGQLGGRADTREVALGMPSAAGVQAKQAVLTRASALFHVGRLFAYAGLGALAASSVQLLGWLTVHSAAIRPIWTLVHLAACALGLVLLFQARQPVWLDVGAKKIWHKVQTHRFAQSSLTPLAMGGLWAFMPCGLLYSALLVAGLTGRMVDGAWFMALFTVGTSMSLVAGPWVWLRLKHFNQMGQWGIRLAGLSLAATSAWAVWMGLAHNTAPWCVTPPI